jgi:hypothetical protein
MACLAQVRDFHESNSGVDSKAVATQPASPLEASGCADSMVRASFIPFAESSELHLVHAFYDSSILRLRPHHEHLRIRRSVLMLSYRVEGTALSAVTRPVFLLWQLASKVSFGAILV